METDIDGRLFYTDIKNVKIPDGKNRFTLVYNPVTSEALLKYECVEQGEVRIRVADHLCRVVMMKQLKVAAGINQIKLQTAYLTRGIYEVELFNSKGHQQHIRMMKE